MNSRKAELLGELYTPAEKSQGWRYSNWKKEPGRIWLCQRKNWALPWSGSIGELCPSNPLAATVREKECLGCLCLRLQPPQPHYYLFHIKKETSKAEGGDMS